MQGRDQVLGSSGMDVSSLAARFGIGGAGGNPLDQIPARMR